MKNKLLYFGLLVVTLYLAILYDSPMLLGFGLMEMVLPAISGILMLWTAAHMKAQIYLPIGVAEKEQPVNVGVRIENKSRIPVSRLEAKIKIQNRFYQPEKEVIFQGMADGRGTTRLTTAITSSQCGLVALWVEQVKIWDLFHLFGKRIETDGKEELSVLPEYYEALIEITPQVREQLIESEEYDEKRPGDDPSQIFQIREYREGDRMQRIHWKASARTSQLMVKDYSMPIGLGALLLFDLQVPEESGAVFLDQAIEYGLAILQGFLNQEYPPRAAWYNCRTQNMEQMEIRETEDLYLLTSRLFQAESYREEILLEEVYKHSYPQDGYSICLRITTDGQWWEDGILKGELTRTGLETEGISV